MGVKITTKNVALRPYRALTAFDFRGLHFNPGDTFDPIKAQCSGHKLRILLNTRKLDISRIPDEKGAEQPAPMRKAATVPTPPPVAETAAEGQTDSPSGDVLDQIANDPSTRGAVKGKRRKS